ncbi:electron transport complex subunit RsxA [Feifania hominis]|uniref:Ion-translocating oxidoreductase complex subunit A n=1 Tax=Feifania hominis TaxID=2763660 RepID=A0A926HQI8_9FIRM|nr:electron transport complex subunit RsxA [Feifania hominis]MBC8536387.1 electron transport complex subunit RsxA [Feifania hominis]
MAEIFMIAINAMLIENFVLVKFLGICPFLGVSKKTGTAVGMGLAVTFTMTLSSALTWAVNRFILQPFHLGYLQTIAFILVIAALVQFVEMALRRLMPALYQSLGIYLPLITTNCAVLGAALLNIQRGYNFIESVAFGFFAALGFLLAIVIFSGVRERIELCDIPRPFQGFPIALISAALLSLAFFGFQGLKINL